MPIVTYAQRETPVAPRVNRAPAGEATLVVGVSGARQNGAVAVAQRGRLRAACEQERITRVRSCPLVPGTLPEDVLVPLLTSNGHTLADIRTFVTAESGAVLPETAPVVRFDHHYGHAATAALTSPATSAAVLVCDRHGESPVSVWRLDAGRLTQERWTWRGEGFASLYTRCAELLGFGPKGEHRLEAIARLHDGGTSRESWHVVYEDGALSTDPAWTSTVGDLVGDPRRMRVECASAIAASFQRAMGDALVALVRDIRAELPFDDLCLGGGLFYNTYFNTRIVESGVFPRVFVSHNPGNAGVAAGAALAVALDGNLHGTSTGPFLGPEFDAEAIKATLDNCKLTYELLSETQLVSKTAEALRQGALVGWFHGAMEWGHRALGNRCILANPFAPHVLENLNVYLKRRESYRSYGVSVPLADAVRYFHYSAPSDRMELEYAPHEPVKFQVLPRGARRLRVQTLSDDSSLFTRLHRAFGAATGAPVLVNTSFNGFHEPIVCSPRDAVRVFYGSGLDVLVLGRFIIRK